MNKELLFEMLNDIDSKYIIENRQTVFVRKSYSFIKYSVAAAAFVMLVCGLLIPFLYKYNTHGLNQAGGTNGPINTSADLKRTGINDYFSDKEAFSYLLTVKDSIYNDLIASGVNINSFKITEHGYCHIRTGNDGNSMAVNWRDYLAYDNNKLVAIITVTKDSDVLKHFISFGGEWFTHYSDILNTYKGQELVFIYIGDVEAVITPDNQVISLQGSDISDTIEAGEEYYNFFKSDENIYIPE